MVLPAPFRNQLGIDTGGALTASMEGERVVLTAKPQKKFKGRIIKDPITGLPALTFGPDAPKLTSERVAELLADFP